MASAIFMNFWVIKGTTAVCVLRLWMSRRANDYSGAHYDARQANSCGLTALRFIKIDAEGGELDIGTEAWGYRAAETHDSLAARRYCWFRADRDGFLQPSPAKAHYIT